MPQGITADWFFSFFSLPFLWWLYYSGLFSSSPAIILTTPASKRTKLSQLGYVLISLISNIVLKRINGIPFNVWVGNGFMRSARYRFCTGTLNGKWQTIRRECIHAFRNAMISNLAEWMAKRQKCVLQNTIQQTPVAIQPFGRSKSVLRNIFFKFYFFDQLMNADSLKAFN